MTLTTTQSIQQTLRELAPEVAEQLRADNLLGSLSGIQLTCEDPVVVGGTNAITIDVRFVRTTRAVIRRYRLTLEGWLLVRSPG